MIIKICGIQNVADAVCAIEHGADWIGIMHYTLSIRYVELSAAKAIAAATHAAGGVAVGVFGDANAQTIQQYCEHTGITHVQLHGPYPRQEHPLLSSYLTRIYVRHVNPDGQCEADNEYGERYLNAERDYLLFDGLQGGSGQTYAWKPLPVPSGMRYLLSGGLRPDNVATAISMLHPDGVDVSSGVESSPGKKCQALIKAFITNARLAEDIE